MKKEEIVALGVDEETASKIVDMSLKEINGMYVPKERFNEINEAKKTAESLLKERESQLETLKGNAGNKEALEKKIEELQEKNQKANEKYKTDLKTLKVDNAVDKAIRERNGLNVIAIKALLTDLDNAEFNEDGTIKGLSKQLDKLVEAENSKMLFGSTNPNIKGVKPSGGNSTPPESSNDDISKMSYAELVKYLEEHPDAVI